MALTERLARLGSHIERRNTTAGDDDTMCTDEAMPSGGSGSSVGAPLSTSASPLPATAGRHFMSQSTGALPAPSPPPSPAIHHAPPPPPSPAGYHYASPHEPRCHSTPPVPVSVAASHHPPPPQWAAASQDQFATLLQRLSTSSDGSPLGQSRASVAPASAIYGGIETLAEIRGCEVYHYRTFGAQVRPQRLEGLHSFEQLILMDDVRATLETHVNPDRPTGGNTLCINGPRGSGIATAIHLHCRSRGINLIDCHNTVGLGPGWDWTLVQRIQNTTEPFVLMMHRFDTLWDAQYRHETMGTLFDRWRSLACMSPGLVRSLIWVTSLGGPENVYPPYAQNFPSIHTCSVDMFHWNESDVSALLANMLERYGYRDALLPAQLAAVAQHTNVLHSPGRVHDLVVAVTSAQTVSAVYMLRVVEQMRKSGLLSASK